MSQKYEERVSHAESSTRFIKQQMSDDVAAMEEKDEPKKRRNLFKLKPSFFTSAVAGGIAGIVVDLSLYPLDTFKTRLQSKEGFRASGGFKGIYKGIIPVLMFSAPISALFFVTYNAIINSIRTQSTTFSPVAVVVAASAAEIICSGVRVPIEIVKQRRQTTDARNVQIIKEIAKKEGKTGFYRGFWSTLLREVPFCMIQYPLWEHLEEKLLLYYDVSELSALDTALCGAAAGAIAAVCTTPMDVIKTRMMLAERTKLEIYKKSINMKIAKEIYRDRGIRGFFAGVLPRVLWITLGGFIYFGTYGQAKIVCEKNKDRLLEWWSPFVITPERPKPDEVTEEDVYSPLIDEKIPPENNEKTKAK